MAGRESLSIPEFDDALDDFAPRGGGGAGQGAPSRPEAARKAVDAVSHFPSREAPADAQLNLKGPREVLDRFKALCKADRRTYADMLGILMDRFEGKT